MRSKLIQIGNSKGIRLPKALIEQYQFGPEIELEMLEEGLMLKTALSPRSGWADAFSQSKDESQYIDDKIQNDWDETEWEW